MKATHPRDYEDPYPMWVSVAWPDCPAIALAMAGGVTPLLAVSHHRATLHLHQRQAPSAQMAGNYGGDVKKGAVYGR